MKTKVIVTVLCASILLFSIHVKSLLAYIISGDTTVIDFSFLFSNKTKIICPRCQTDFLLSDCFRDIAATMELKKAIIQCESPGCPWEGKSERYVVRITLALCV